MDTFKQGDKILSKSFLSSLSTTILFWTALCAMLVPSSTMQWNGTHAICSDGTLELDSTWCGENNCTAGNYTCPNGFCAANLEHCALTSNCPLDRPYICPNLVCVSNPANCTYYPAFKHRPPFLNLTESTTFVATYMGEKMTVRVEWNSSAAEETFNVLVVPVSDEEAKAYELVTENSDQALAIRMAIQPGTSDWETTEFNHLLAMMSPIVNISTENGGDFPVDVNITLQINPHFNYSTYKVAIFDTESGRLRSDSTSDLNITTTSSGSKLATFTQSSSGIYAVIYYPHVTPGNFYSFVDCGWACEYPKEFMMVFFSAVYISMVIAITFWCVAVQTQQRRFDKAKAIRRQMKSAEAVEDDKGGNSGNGGESKEEIKKQTDDNNVPELNIPEAKAVEEEKLSSPSVADYSFGHGGSPPAAKEEAKRDSVLMLKLAEPEPPKEAPTVEVAKEEEPLPEKASEPEPEPESKSEAKADIGLDIDVSQPPNPPSAKQSSLHMELQVDEAKESESEPPLPDESNMRDKGERNTTGAGVDDADIKASERSNEDSGIRKAPTSDLANLVRSATHNFK